MNYARVFCVLALSSACSSGGARTIADPIPDIPRNQQRTIDRSELGLSWPLSVGTGTLGCSSGAVVFRAGGVNYALNDAARSRSLAAVDPIWQFQSSGPPSNPLKGVNQDQRMRVFSESAACDRGADASICKQRLRATARLSEADLKQIEAEGVERRWPPLERPRIRIDPLVAAGLKLCAQR